MSARTGKTFWTENGIKKKFKKEFQPSLCTKHWKMQANFQETVFIELFKTKNCEAQ